MPTVTLGEDDIVQTKVLCWVNYQVGLNQRHFRVASNPGEFTLEDWAGHVVNVLVPLYTAYLSTAVIVDAIKVQKVNPPNSEELTVLGPWPGLATATTMPRQAAGIITLTTGLGGRAYRGRVYVPFPTEEMNEAGGSPNAAGIAAMQNLADFYSQSQNVTIGDNTMILNPVLVHGGPAPLAPTAITGSIVRDKWATQLRRGDYGRLNERLSS